MPDEIDPSRTTAAPPKDPNASAAGSADETAPYGAGKPNFGPSATAGEVGMLGPYRVVKELGKGGMGAVYLATDTRLGRKLALKVMLPEFAADRDAKERFLREARAAAMINHDNVVTVYEADERDGVPYITMQFLQGQPLDEYLKNKGAPALTHIVRIATETALGLAAAHKLGLVHRDIKPANLWLETLNGRVKVLDFGLAKPIGSDSELTKSGAVVGTPAYMSPEQARGMKVDHRTDLFSLGAVLYKLSTGQNPFNGPNVMAVLTALAVDDPTPVRELNPNVPEPLAQLIHQLLAKKPEHRPQSANEVAARLRTILGGLSNRGAPAVGGVVSASSGVSASVPVVIDPVPHQSPVVTPMHVTATPESAFADLTDDEEADEATEAADPLQRPKEGGKKLAALGAVLLAGVAVAVVVMAMNTGKKGEPLDPSPVEKPKDGDKLAMGEWIDLLALDERLVEHSVDHDGALRWTKRQGKWTSPHVPGEGSQVALPLVATGSYNLVAEVSRDDGEEVFAVTLPVGPDHSVGFDLYNFGTFQGFSGIKGRQPHEEQNPTRRPQPPLPVGRVVTIAIGVRVNGSRVELQAAVDNGPSIRWAGPVADLAYQFGTRERIGLLSAGSRWTVHSLKFQKIDGEITVLTSPPPAAAWTDLTPAGETDWSKWWEAQGAQDWKLQDGELFNANSQSGWIGTKVEYTDFEIELEFKFGAKGNSGIFLRAEPNGDVNKFVEIQLADDAANKYTGAMVSGSVFRRIAANPQPTVKPNEWNTARVAVIGKRVAVTVNGTKCLDADVEAFPRSKGMIGLQQWDSAVHFRNVRVRDLTAVATADPDRKAAEWVLSVGGTVTVEAAGKEVRVTAAKDLPAGPLAVLHVTLHECTERVRDADLARLRNLPRLASVSLFDTKTITDAGVAHLRESTGLQALHLGGTAVTDVGLTELKGLTALTGLYLESTGVTDAGAAVLAGMPRLQWVHLSDTDVSDGGLERLTGLTELRLLELKRTKVTAAGVKKLAEKLPKCRIEWDGGIVGPAKK